MLIKKTITNAMLSIGAITAGEDIRAGRWWWENPESKECGLHVKATNILRQAQDERS